MNQNKVNPWMISTAVLALVGGFLIGCEVQSPRQQLGAQTSSGVTASELDFITGKYNGIPDSLSAAVIDDGSSYDPGFNYTDVLTVPPGKIFVATSIHGAFPNAEHYRNSSQWLGKNYDPAIGLPIGTNLAQYPNYFDLDQLVSGGLVPGSRSMCDWDQGLQFLNSRNDMEVIYREGDVLSLCVFHSSLPADSNITTHYTINGYWLNAE